MPCRNPLVYENLTNITKGLLNLLLRGFGTLSLGLAGSGLDSHSGPKLESTIRPWPKPEPV